MTAPSDAARTELTPDALYGKLHGTDPVAILDVRNRDEHDAWRIDGAARTVVIPYMEFAQARATGDLSDLLVDLDPLVEASPDPVVVVCGRGEASDTVAGWLREAGVDAVNLAGGMRGWAKVYNSTPVPVAADVDAGGTDAEGLTIIQYDRPASGCLAYLLVAGDEAAVVDPLRAFADRYVADARDRGARIRYAIDTHVHADHVSGTRAVVAAATDDTAPTAWSPAVVVPAGATDRGLTFDARQLRDGDRLPLGDVSLEAIHLPGHTTENTGIIAGGVIFGGDSLFVDSVARPDLEAGASGARELAGTLYETLHDRLLPLADAPETPDDVTGGLMLAPTHRSPSDPRRTEAFVAPLAAVTRRVSALSLDKASFVEYLLSDMPPRPNNFERIIETNLGRTDATDEEAFEWELGPNNCAATVQSDASAD